MAMESKQQTKDTIAARLEGRRRVVIEGVKPEIDCGEFPIQRVVGETVAVEADVFADGHDAVAAQLLYRRSTERTWRTMPMEPLGNDRWRAEFAVMELGEYRYTVEGWVDTFTTWRNDMKKRIEADQETHVERMAGSALVAAAVKRAKKNDAKSLKNFAAKINDTDQDAASIASLDPTLESLMHIYAEHAYSTRYAKELSVSGWPRTRRILRLV